MNFSNFSTIPVLQKYKHRKQTENGKRGANRSACPVQTIQPQGKEGLAQECRRYADLLRPRRGAGPDNPRVRSHQLVRGVHNVFFLTWCSGVIAEKPSDELFAIDTTGDAQVQKAYNRRHKPLKADEILSKRSAIPSVSSKKRLSEFAEEKKRKKTKISQKEYDRLRSIAYGGDQVQKDIVETGEVADHDPWAVQEVKKDPRFSFLDEKKPTKEPATLKQAPVSLAKSGKAIPAVRKPEGGKSYNPNFNDWQALVTREGDKAVEAEKQRLKEAQEEAERMERAMALSDDESDANESAWESEWDGFSDEEDKAAKQKRPERKTPAQRNKFKRKKEAEGRAKHEARMKAKDQQLQRIKELQKSVEEKEKAREALQNMTLVETNDASSEDEGEEVLRKKRFGKH